MTTVDIDKQFEELTPVFNAFAYKLTQDHDQAKDLYQETAFRVMKNREKFDPGTNFKAWVFTIMKNIFINDYRRRKKANTIADSTDNMFYLNSGKNSISNHGEANVLIRELRNMISKLEDDLRIPFLMHYQGFKYQEIADKFGLPLGTIKSRIFFARRELKHQVKNRYNNVEEMVMRA